MTAAKVCAIKRCQDQARWTVSIVGHPNATGPVVADYCTPHAQADTLWEDSPRPYTVTVTGPLP